MCIITSFMYPNKTLQYTCGVSVIDAKYYIRISALYRYIYITNQIQKMYKSVLLYCVVTCGAYTLHDLGDPTQYDCAGLCFGDIRCMGHSINLHNDSIERCLHVYVDDTMDAMVGSIIVPQGFHPIIHKNWSGIQSGTQLCYPQTRQCVMCSEYPTQWMTDVGPYYTVYIIPTCRGLFNGTTVYKNTYTFEIPPGGIQIPYPHLLFMGLGSFVFNASSCPVFNVTNTALVNTLSVSNLTILCPESQHAHSSIHITNIPSMALLVQNLKIYNVITGIYLRGGVYDTSPTDEINIGGSLFSNVLVFPGADYISPYVFVLVSFMGNPVTVQNFNTFSKVMYMPFLDTEQITEVTYIGTRPRIINESYMTDIVRAGHQLVSSFLSNPLDDAYHMYVSILLIGNGILLGIIFLKFQAVLWPPKPHKID